MKLTFFGNVVIFLILYSVKQLVVLSHTVVRFNFDMLENSYHNYVSATFRKLILLNCFK